MTNEYIYITGQNGETYEICPTEALLSFLQRLAEEEEAEEASRGFSSDEVDEKVNIPRLQMRR
jgi:hypothetical protein